MEEVEEQEVMALARTLQPSVRNKPKVHANLESWIGYPFAAMGHSVLCLATEHFRDSGHLGFSALRRFSAALLGTGAGSAKVSTDVRGWQKADLLRFLAEHYGERFSHQGLPDDDWDPQQYALANAVCHINNHDEGTNSAWKAHIGSYMGKVVGFSPRRHEAITLASFLVLRQATTPGSGPLQHYGPRLDRGRGGERGGSSCRGSENHSRWAGEWSSDPQQGASSHGASSSHQDRPRSSTHEGWAVAEGAASDSRHSRAWEDRSWHGPYHPWRSHERSSWQAGENAPWTAAGRRPASSQAPQSRAWEWTRQDTWQTTGTGWGSPTEAGGTPPPWRTEATGWPRPRAEASPTDGRGARPPPLPYPGRIEVGLDVAAGFFVQQLQRVSLGWSETWKRWRLNRPVPGGGWPTLNPVKVHDEAAVFLGEYALDGLFQEWRDRTNARLAQHGERSTSQATGAGRGTRRGREEYDEGWAEGQCSARRRR